MKIVIDIDNETYGRIQALVNADYFEHDICGYSMQKIANGTPYEERPTGKWIPCGERLPDLYEVVLVTDECGKVFEYERRPLDEEGNVSREWSFLGRNIIAWMPLPLPYEQEEAEND